MKIIFESYIHIQNANNATLIRQCKYKKLQNKVFFLMSESAICISLDAAKIKLNHFSKNCIVF